MFQISDLSSHFKKLEEQIKYKASRIKKIIKIRVKINEPESTQTIELISKTKEALSSKRSTR